MTDQNLRHEAMIDPAYALPPINGRQYTIKQVSNGICVMDDNDDCVLQFIPLVRSISIEGLKGRLGSIEMGNFSWNLYETPIQGRTELGCNRASQAVALSAISLLSKGRA